MGSDYKPKGIEILGDEQEFEQNNTSFTCNICATDLNTEQIQTEVKYNIDVAYIDCPECDNRFNLMFDNKETIKLKAKIKKVKEIEHYLQLQLYREMLLV